MFFHRVWKSVKSCWQSLGTTRCARPAPANHIHNRQSIVWLCPLSSPPQHHHACMPSPPHPLVTICLPSTRHEHLYITRAPIGSVLPAATVAQRCGRDLLVVVSHLLSNPSCRREGGASWADVAVTPVAGIGGPAAEVAGLVARPLPLGEMARVVAQLGCDRGLHQHVPLRVQSVPVVGGVNVLVDTAM